MTYDLSQGSPILAAIFAGLIVAAIVIIMGKTP
jgi:hypothetical protein